MFIFPAEDLWCVCIFILSLLESIKKESFTVLWEGFSSCNKNKKQSFPRWNLFFKFTKLQSYYYYSSITQILYVHTVHCWRKFLVRAKIHALNYTTQIKIPDKTIFRMDRETKQNIWTYCCSYLLHVLYTLT